MLSTGVGFLKSRCTLRVGQRAKLQRLYGNSTILRKIRSSIQKLHARLTQSFSSFFVFLNSSDLPQPSIKWCQYSTLRMFSVQRIKELSSELAGYDYLRKRWTKRKVYCVCDLWSAVWSFDVFFGIPKTIVLEILDWSILYELLISFNPISSML